VVGFSRDEVAMGGDCVESYCGRGITILLSLEEVVKNIGSPEIPISDVFKRA